MGLTKQNFKSILKAGIFAFISGFLATLTAQGGFQIGLGWEGVVSMIGGASVAGINMALFAIYKFFENEKEGK